jgi:ribosome-associated toxin RatA of RatAB toxin-antitoxin module
MNQQTRAETVMAAGVDEVMAVLTDLPSYPEWARGVSSVEVLESRPDGRPFTARFEVSSGPVKGSYTLAYSFEDLTDGERMAWTLVESSLLKSLDGEYIVGASGDGASVEYRLSMVPSFALIGPLRRKAEQQLVSTAIDDLRRRVEGAR